MKICYFICSNIFGGVENIVINTLNELSKTDEVALITPKNCSFKDKLSKNVKLYEYQSFDKRYNPFLYLEIAKIAKNYELIHTHGAKATQIFYIINKFLNKKFVATKHNIRKGKIFNRTKNVLAVSKEVANTIKNESKVIYFGIKKIDIVPKKLTDKFSMVSVGRLDPIKGFAELISSVSKLNFEYKLYIVGSGKEEQNLKNLINGLKLNDKVELLSFRDDIKEILNGSGMQIISSRSEGLPNTLLEGIFYSNLLISTDVGGIKEILEPKFLFDINECDKKLKEIKENYGFYKDEFLKFAKPMQEKLSFEKYLYELKEYYKEVK
ncbi:glycosyltransferase [Campylobacter sp. RM9344]|uniref:Glycosyltransferase n=1 Tax=Campylobacter californiensis TaxID=1032243 RepID=A0AAW3ZRZ4_9BACT|nr:MULTISPECIES: glycosyltransferase [unclassified Campylobacter]MBE2984325.1 glycosyltransferase [Campylobacter sp. RM6883]MBE2985921.1 glycosyltransferase [Campylobacter sp. RM12919]MBE2988122.1 glycosyltransferase [Campylobacter sp. RM12920]MBE2994808.1 glycosyltransferase [Campylobacter sp. RM6913]MBE3029416.1 glycosyltransferase [Campylobacter sp. RM9344]